MESLASAANQRELFQRALDLVLGRLSPERAFILFGQGAYGCWITQASYGISEATRSSVLTSGEISLQPLRRVLETGVPVVVLDAQTDPRYSDRSSVMVSGIRSVVCAPWKNLADQVVGLLYADHRVKSGVFDQEHLGWLSSLAAAIGERLRQLQQAEPAVGPGPA